MKRIFASLLTAVMLVGSVLTAGVPAYAASSTNDTGSEWDIKYDEIPFRVQSDYGSSSDQMIVQAQKLFISYNTLVNQRAELDRQLQVGKKTLEAARKQVELKMMTQLDFDNLNKSLDTLESSIASMDTQIEALRKSFATIVGGDYKGHYEDGDSSHRVRLRKLPDVHKFVKDLDINYSSDVDHSSLDTEQDKASFTSIYQSVRDKEALLEKEEQYYELQKKNFEASKLKNQLGLLSTLDFIKAQDAVDAEAYKVTTAQTDLFSAAAKYQWATDRNVVNS